MQKIKHFLRAINAENIKEWKIEISYKTDFIRTFIEPIVYLLPYFFYGLAVVGGRHSDYLKKLTGYSDIITYILLGYVLMGFLGTACWAMGMAIRKELWYGTLESVFVAPVPRWVYIAGMALHSTLHQGLIMIFQTIVIALSFKIVLNLKNIWVALIPLILMVLSLYGLGILIAGLTLLVKQGWTISEAVYTLLTVITPIAYPLSVMPDFLQKVSLTRGRASKLT